jgi:thiol-disulfide isomerase/thioredoxin
MRSFLLLVAALSTLLVSCQKNTSTISGTLLGADGKPMPLAHVHLAGAVQSPARGNPLNDPVIVSQKVREDGKFELTTHHTGPLMLLCTGVGHTNMSIPLPLVTQTDVSLDIRLGSALPDTSRTEIEILSSVDGGATRQRNYLAKQSDGSFQADITTPGDSLWYTMYATDPDSWGTTAIGATAQNYGLISGAEFAEARSQPEYVAIVPIVDGHARVEYRAPTQVVVAAGSYKFRDTPSTVASVAEIRNNVMRHDAASQIALQNHIRNGKPPQTFVYPWLDLADTLAQRVDKTRDRLLRDELALELLECYQRAHTSVNNPDRRQFIVEVAPASLAWVYHGTLGLATRKIPEMGETYFNSIVDTHPWRSYSAYLLFYQCQNAMQVHADSTVTAALGRLLRDFEDTPGARQAEDLFGLRDPIRVGSPFPEFAFHSANDTNAVFTNALFRGQHLLVVFWSTACSPCIAEMPALHRAYEAYGKSGLRILSVTLGNRPDQIARFRKLRWPMPWSVAFVPTDNVPRVVTRFQAGTPRHVLIDPVGNICMTDSMLREVDLDSTLAHLLTHTGPRVQ